MSSVEVQIRPQEFGALKGLRNKGTKLEITVKGYLVSDGIYSKWTGDAYELAEIHTYGLGVPKRPFIYNAKKYIKEHSSEKNTLKDRIKKHTKITGKSFDVNWYYAGRFLESKIRSLMKSGKLGLVPLASDTLYRRDLAGYGKKPLYASGGLADCITWQEV